MTVHEARSVGTHLDNAIEEMTNLMSSCNQEYISSELSKFMKSPDPAKTLACVILVLRIHRRRVDAAIEDAEIDMDIYQDLESLIERDIP